MKKCPFCAEEQQGKENQDASLTIRRLARLVAPLTLSFVAAPSADCDQLLEISV